MCIKIITENTYSLDKRLLTRWSISKFGVAQTKMKLYILRSAKKKIKIFSWLYYITQETENLHLLTSK